MHWQAGSLSGVKCQRHRCVIGFEVFFPGAELCSQGQHGPQLDQILLIQQEHSHLSFAEGIFHTSRLSRIEAGASPGELPKPRIFDDRGVPAPLRQR